MTKSETSVSPQTTNTNKSNQDKAVNYNSIIRFLTKLSSMGAKLFLSRPNQELKAIHFDPNQLNTEKGKEFIDFLIEAEKYGAKVLISDPYRGLNKISFLDNKKKSVKSKIRSKKKPVKPRKRF